MQHVEICIDEHIELSIHTGDLEWGAEVGERVETRRPGH